MRDTTTVAPQATPQSESGRWLCSENQVFDNEIRTNRTLVESKIGGLTGLESPINRRRNSLE
jgi:hypothetical protein